MEGPGSCERRARWRGGRQGPRVAGGCHASHRAPDHSAGRQDGVLLWWRGQQRRWRPRTPAGDSTLAGCCAQKEPKNEPSWKDEPDSHQRQLPSSACLHAPACYHRAGSKLPVSHPEECGGSAAWLGSIGGGAAWLGGASAGPSTSASHQRCCTQYQAAISPRVSQAGSKASAAGQRAPTQRPQQESLWEQQQEAPDIEASTRKLAAAAAAGRGAADQGKAHQ